MHAETEDWCLAPETLAGSYKMLWLRRLQRMAVSKGHLYESPTYSDHPVVKYTCGITTPPFYDSRYTYDNTTTRPTRTHVYNER